MQKEICSMSKLNILEQLKNNPKETTEYILVALALSDMEQSTAFDDVFVPGEDIVIDGKIYRAKKELSKNE